MWLGIEFNFETCLYMEKEIGKKENQIINSCCKQTEDFITNQNFCKVKRTLGLLSIFYNSPLILLSIKHSIFNIKKSTFTKLSSKKMPTPLLIFTCSLWIYRLSYIYEKHLIKNKKNIFWKISLKYSPRQKKRSILSTY